MEWSLQNHVLSRVAVTKWGGTRRWTRRPPMFVRLASPVVAGLLAQGVTTRPPGLLTVRGRNTGRPHTTSVAVFKSGGRHWLAAIFGEVDWTRNLRATGEGMLTQGRSRTGVIAVERTPEAGGVVLRDAVARDAPSRLAAWFVRRYVEITPDAQQTEFVAVARQHPVFELRESSRVISHGRRDSMNDRRHQ